MRRDEAFGPAAPQQPNFVLGGSWDLVNGRITPLILGGNRVTTYGQLGGTTSRVTSPVPVPVIHSYMENMENLQNSALGS